MKRNKLPGIILLACCALFAGMQANAKGIEVRNGNIILDFSTKNRITNFCRNIYHKTIYRKIQRIPDDW